MEKVFAELEWMSKNKMEFVYCVDANFGMFERDEAIANKLVELKNTTGYPNRLQVSYAKNAFTFRIFPAVLQGKRQIIRIYSKSRPAQMRRTAFYLLYLAV